MRRFPNRGEYHVAGSPILRGAHDQRFDEAVLSGEVMQQTALAYARLGGDGVERKLGDALAHDHRLCDVQPGVLQLAGICLYHGNE